MLVRIMVTPAAGGLHQQMLSILSWGRFYQNFARLGQNFLISYSGSVVIPIGHGRGNMIVFLNFGCENQKFEIYAQI